MKAEVLPFLDLIISETREVKPRKKNEDNWIDCLDKTPNAFTPTFKKRKLDKQEQTKVLLELFPELSLNMYSNLRHPD